MTKVMCLDTLKTVIYILSKEGLLFSEKITKFGILKVAVNFSLAAVLNALAILNIISGIKANNMELVNWMVCVLIPALLCATKAVTFVINRKCFLSILQDLSSLSFNAHNYRLNRHIHLIDRVSTLLLKYFIIADIVIIIAFCILPFAINMRMVVPPPFHTGRFDVLYKLFHLILCSYVGGNMASFDTLYMTLMGLGVAQLNILKERLTDVFEDVNNLAKVTGESILSEINAGALHILKECIILHKIIIK